MSIETLLLFLPACFALNMAPGPNNLLSIANGTRYGFTKACIAGAGRLLAFVGMIALAASGLAVVLLASEIAFYCIKIAGALYLFYLAVQLWRSEPAEVVPDSQAERTIWLLAKQEFLVAVGNPKAILIFTAFLPQFVNTAHPAGSQFFILGSAFLVLELLAIAAYAYLGSHLRKWFSMQARKRAFNRICASLLGLAGVGLLLTRRSASGA
jgi:threonine/homoserine/homoserine lactone efflux protein